MRLNNAEQQIDTIAMSGVPGSGKGTATEFMSAKFKELGKESGYFAAGDMVRAHIKNQTPFAAALKRYSEAGELVPDSIIIPEIRRSIGSLDTNALWFLDGFPRNEDQIEPYEEIMDELGRVDVMVKLELDKDPKVVEEIVLGRMRGRVQEYIARGETPRKDDLDEKTVLRRLKEAELLTPVFEHFALKDKLIVIDAKRSIDEVREEISSKVLSLVKPAEVNAEMSNA